MITGRLPSWTRGAIGLSGKVETPDRFQPLASLLAHLKLDEYLELFEPGQRDDLSELVRRLTRTRTRTPKPNPNP